VSEQTSSNHDDPLTAESGAVSTDDHQATANELISAVIDVLQESRPVPLSTQVMVPKEELIAALEEALAALPEEIRAARWLLKERDEFLQTAQSEADDIVAAGRTQAEQMVRRTELVRQSEIYGRRIRDQAEAEARHWRRQTEDFCEQRLEQFEMTLGKIARTVQQGRDRLRALPEGEASSEDGHATGSSDEDGVVIDLTDERVAGTLLLFDQDID
jgi:hypothetical protein